MRFLTSFLGGWQMYAVIGAAVLAALAYHRIKVSNLELDLAGTQTSLAQCIAEGVAVTADRDKLLAELARQNEHIDALARGAREGEAGASAAASDILRLAGESRRRDMEDPETGPARMNRFMAEVFP